MAYPPQISLWRKYLLICHTWVNSSRAGIKNHFLEEKCGMDFPGRICGGGGEGVGGAGEGRDFPGTYNNECKTVELLVQSK